jgi:uncharacterized protein YeaO (DUF488 family)
MSFKIKRVYDPAEKADGLRVLVDRLWPRGLKKVDAHLTQWLKEVAPSPKLRTWFDHKPDRFEEFERRYRLELADNPALGELRKLGKADPVTLLYAARDPEVNHARVLCAVLLRRRLRPVTSRTVSRPARR